MYLFAIEELLLPNSILSISLTEPTQEPLPDLWEILPPLLDLLAELPLPPKFTTLPGLFFFDTLSV